MHCRWSSVALSAQLRRRQRWPFSNTYIYVYVVLVLVCWCLCVFSEMLFVLCIHMFLYFLKNRHAVARTHPANGLTVNLISIALTTALISHWRARSHSHRNMVEYLTVLFGAHRNRRRAGALAALRTSRQPDVVQGVRIQEGQIVRFRVGDASARRGCWWMRRRKQKHKVGRCIFVHVCCYYVTYVVFVLFVTRRSIKTSFHEISKLICSWILY